MQYFNMRALPVFTILLITCATGLRAQTIDSFHLKNPVNPHELFVRLRFPDSSYYLSYTLHRVALSYPPINVVTFVYRSCQGVRANPQRDTTMPIFTPPPYKLLISLVKDSNTTAGCLQAAQLELTDSVSYTSQTTGIGSPGAGNAALTFFPNPAVDALQVSGTPGTELRITDGIGKLQWRGKLRHAQETVNIGMLPAGVYYLHGYRDGMHPQRLRFSKRP